MILGTDSWKVWSEIDAARLTRTPYGSFTLWETDLDIDSDSNPIPVVGC